MRVSSEPAAPAAHAVRLGAYGFCVPGLGGGEALLQPVPDTAPELGIDVVVAPSDDRPSVVDADRADLRLLTGGRLRANRGDSTVRLILGSRPPAQELVHPYLAAAAGLVWRWPGREALHAGAVHVEAAGGAVLVLGGKEAGKSTTLAWLAGVAGAGVMADDLAVIDEGRVVSGPRSIDLRAEAVAMLRPGAADAIARVQPVRGGERARMALGPVPHDLAVVGVATLGWAPEVHVTPVPLADRWALLASQRYFPTLATDGASVLALVSVPTVRIGRPRGPTGLAAAAQALLDAFT